MQRKLTAIVATDFFCWMPVCTMGFLQVGGQNHVVSSFIHSHCSFLSHFSWYRNFPGVGISKDAYLPTGLILLPINSALNPFLYSNLPDIIWNRTKTLRVWIRRGFRICGKDMFYGGENRVGAIVECFLVGLSDFAPTVSTCSLVLVKHSNELLSKSTLLNLFWFAFWC